MTHGKIITRRQFDEWAAYYEVEPETRHIGWGATEAEAIEDLKRLDNERAEAEGECDERNA